MNDELITERFKVVNHRIEDLEKKVDGLSDFKYTVNSLSETVKDLKTTVNTLNSQDGEKYKSYKQAIAIAIIGSIVGILIGNVLTKLL